MCQSNPKDGIHNSHARKELKYGQCEHDRRSDPKGDERKEEMFVANERHARERISGRDRDRYGDHDVDQHLGNRIDERRAQIGIGPDARVI